MARELRGALAALYTCRDGEVLVEGRAGTAKTTGILTKLLDDARRYPGCRILICRQTRASMTESVLVTLERLIGVDNPEVVRMKRDQRHSYHLWGSEIVTGGLDQPDRLFSTEWDRVYVCEAHEIALEAWELFGRAMRHGRTPYHQRIGDVNPNAPGHWLNRRAFACSDTLRDVESRADYDRLQRYNHGKQDGLMRRLVSVHADNPGYWDIARWCWTPAGKEYVENVLGKMTGYRRERMFRGRWRAAEGTVYPMFDREKHVIDPFTVPGDWPIYVGWDPGFDHPTAILWVAVAPNGTLFVIDEIYQGGRTVQQHCQSVTSHNTGRTVRRYYGDPQHAFNRTAQSSKSIAMQARECGIKMLPWPRSTDVEAMVNAVRELLEQQRVKVFATCTNTLDEFETWRHKRTARGEVPSGDDQFEDANNHAMDVVKGLVAARLRFREVGGE